MKVYAYVTSESCRIRRAILPGHDAPNGEAVSRHSDYHRWPFGKRETFAIIHQPATAANYYKRECARVVSQLLDWPIEDEDHCDECGGDLLNDGCICDPLNDEQSCGACGCNDGTCQHAS